VLLSGLIIVAVVKMMEKIQVLIISPQFLFRQGVEHTLSAIENIHISDTLDTGGDIFSSLDNLLPDVALVDIDPSDDVGLKLARNIKQRSPNIGIILMSSNYSDSQLFEALKVQAASLLSKDAGSEDLVGTIKSVANGEHPINESVMRRPKVAEQVLEQFGELSSKSAVQTLMAPLTPREKEILSYVAQGYINKQIAAELEISVQTIKNHVTSILRKLNANVRTEAVVVAIKQGLISLTTD
jgi:two-component system response regulator DegU